MRSSSRWRIKAVIALIALASIVAVASLENKNLQSSADTEIHAGKTDANVVCGAGFIIVKHIKEQIQLEKGASGISFEALFDRSTNGLSAILWSGRASQALEVDFSGKVRTLPIPKSS